MSSPRAPLSLAVCFLALLAATSVAATGCSKKSKNDVTAKADTLPPLTIGEDTPNLMLTWIDPNGGTHVELKPSVVPDEGKKLVRVLISGDEAGTRDPIYIADLTNPEADGKFSTRLMPRSEWEEEIERRRGARVAANGDQDERPSRDSRRSRPRLPPPARQPDLPQVPDLDDDHPRPPSKDPAHGVNIVIYGASWCGPCHMAMKHLDQRHIAYAFKDIDKDPGADTELSGKLAKSHLHGGSIPVIDVGGRLIIGYDAGTLDKAIEQASGGTVL
jgi:glutaredoxin